MIWAPVLRGDRPADAEERAGEWGDQRVSQLWDGRQRLARAFAGPLGLRTLGVRGIAWDVYLVYPPGALWPGEAPPAPAHWEHQLSRLQGARAERFLDPDSLSHAVEKILIDGTVPTP